MRQCLGSRNIVSPVALIVQHTLWLVADEVLTSAGDLYIGARQVHPLRQSEPGDAVHLAPALRSQLFAGVWSL